MSGVYKLAIKKYLSKIFSDIIQNQKIVLVIGTNGTALVAFENDVLLEHTFIALRDPEYIDKIKQFLNQFKDHHVSILLDNTNVKLRHEPIPVLESIIKNNPVKRFLNEHYDNNQLVSYAVYDINTSANEEIYNTLIASTNYQPPLSTIIEHILIQSFELEGVYFLHLEAPIIIDTMLMGVNNKQLLDAVQIVVCILAVSGIKILAKHHQDIKFIKTIEYPYDKSNEYIQGIIEEGIGDALISLKLYLSQIASAEVCIIFVANNKMINLFKQSPFENYQKLYFANEELLKTETTDTFSDVVLTRLCLAHKRYDATNYYIQIIAKLRLLNAILFKPFYALIMILVVVIMGLKFEDAFNERRTLHASKRYYDFTHKYRAIKILPIDMMAMTDLYKIHNLFKIPIPNPITQLDNIFSIITQNIQIKEVRWQLDNVNNNFTTSPRIRLDVKLNYVNANGVLNDANDNLKQDINNINDTFANYKVEYIPATADKIIQIPNRRVIIPVQIIITPQESY